MLSCKYYVRVTQFMFVKILRGALCSLTLDCLNQISEKRRSLWWQNKLCIGGKKLRLIWHAFYFNDTHRERLMFRPIQYRNDWLAASDLFDMFTQSIKFYTFHCQYRCLKNVIHQIDSKNGWLLLSASFTAKFGLVFVLTLENAFS